MGCWTGLSRPNPNDALWMLLYFLVLSFQYERALFLSTMGDGSLYLDSEWLGLQDDEDTSKVITNSGSQEQRIAMSTADRSNACTLLFTLECTSPSLAYRLRDNKRSHTVSTFPAAYWKWLKVDWHASILHKFHAFPSRIFRPLPKRKSCCRTLSRHKNATKAYKKATSAPLAISALAPKWFVFKEVHIASKNPGKRIGCVPNLQYIWTTHNTII